MQFLYLLSFYLIVMIYKKISKKNFKNKVFRLIKKFKLLKIVLIKQKTIHNLKVYFKQMPVEYILKCLYLHFENLIFESVFYSKSIKPYKRSNCLH